MAECPNCGTEVRQEWSLCPHCKVNMRTFTGPPQGRLTRPPPGIRPASPPPAPSPATVPAPTPVAVMPEIPVAPAPHPGQGVTVPVASAAPGTAEEPARSCSRCGAPVVSADALYCMRCGHRVDRRSLADQVEQALSNPVVIGGLGLVFVLLLVGLVLAPGLGSPAPTGTKAGTGLVVDAGGPLNAPSPTWTDRPVTTPSPVVEVPEVIAGPANATPNATPRPRETVLSVRTLDRYIQNAGGDGGDQLATPSSSPTIPLPTFVPGPTRTVTPGPLGDLVWAGEGYYITPPFVLGAGEVRLELAAQDMTMAQLLDANRTVLGIVTAGPNTGGTTVRVPETGLHRIEIWAFGTGPWKVRVTVVANATAFPVPSPTVAPIPVPSPSTTDPGLPSPSVSAGPTPGTTPSPTTTTTPD
ncbi:MAG TPA: zinc ribbon domain-containing protein, partial [Methanoregulaceae archaeon]|nr:zinc ribbon domain-containing protein [Methanoregulaceae archaeon]